MTQPQHLVCLEHPTRQGLVCKLGQRVKGFDKDICFLKKYASYMVFTGGSVGKGSPAMQETRVQSMGWEDLLEKETVTLSSILA